MKQNNYNKQMIRKYNEEIHVGSGLTGDDLYILDESELEDFEKWCKKELLKGKFVIAYDTICDGHQCMLDEDGNPELFDSADEAFIEIFDSNYSMLETHRDSDQLEDLNEGVTPELVTEMGIVLSGGNADEMRAWMERHPLTEDKISDGSGFIIKWCVAEEYKLDFEKDGYNNTLYKVLETSQSYTNKDYVLKSKPNTLHQLLYTGGEKRIVTYREDLHEWLKSLEEQIKGMLGRMLEFFDRDSDKFLQNFTERKLMLGAGNDEKNNM